MTTIQQQTSGYQHRQHAPLCLVLYLVALVMLAVAWFVDDVPMLPYLFSVVGVMLLAVAMSFHYLAVEDEVDRLVIRFGPLPLFRRSVRYEDIVSVETGRTMPIEGWGIHLSPRGGWVWNLWGFDCVVLRFHRGVLRIGSDDAENLAAFIQSRIGRTPQRTMS